MSPFFSGLSRSSSPMSLSKAPLRLLQSSSNLHLDESAQSVSSYRMDSSDSTVTKLHSAAWRGDLDKLKKHLKKNDINCADSQGRYITLCTRPPEYQTKLSLQVCSSPCSCWRPPEHSLSYCGECWQYQCSGQ